jgi:hypothetical protein
MRVEMMWRDAARRLTLRLAPGARMRPPLSRAIEVRIAGERAARRIAFDGRPIDVKL